MQKCKGLIISPAFYIKKRKKFLGIHIFNYLARSNKINAFALGGINESNIQKLKLKDHSVIGKLLFTNR